MRKLVFAALAGVFMLSSGFATENERTTTTTTNESFDKTCYYNVRNSRGERVGGVIMQGVPNDVDCGSLTARLRAIDIWNGN
jgi:hypothetical protein